MRHSVLIVPVCLAALGAALEACSDKKPESAAASEVRPPTAGATAPAADASPPGARAEDANYEVALEPPTEAKAGEAATARVVVKARGHYHVNREYPTSFKPDAAALETFGAEKVALGQGADRTPCASQPAEACAMSAPLPFTPRGPGDVRLAGTVAFSVCSAEQCLIEKVPLAATVAAR